MTSVIAVMESLYCKLASYKWWKYLHGMLGGLLDCDGIDIVISSRQLLAIKVEHRQSA